MGVLGLNSIISKTPREMPRQYRRVVIDGSNLIFAKLASAVSSMVKEHKILEWDSIDKNILYQTKFIITQASKDIIYYINDKCFKQYAPEEVYFVMDPRVTPCYRVNVDMTFVNEQREGDNFTVSEGTLKDNEYIEALLTPEEIDEKFDVEFNIKEEEQEKRKAASDKAKQIEAAIKKIRALDIDPDYSDIITNIYNQSYHYRNIPEMLKLSSAVLLNVEQHFQGKKMFIVDAGDEADLVIKNIVHYNIGSEVAISPKWQRKSESIENVSVDTNESKISDGDRLRQMLAEHDAEANDNADIDVDPNDHADILTDVQPTVNVESNVEPKITVLPKLEDIRKDYTLVISMDTDYCILFSDSPYVHCKTLADNFIYSPYKCWRNYLGDAYSYDAVIRIAALFGNDYTTKKGISSATNHPDDMKCLFNISDDYKLKSILSFSKMKTMFKVVPLKMYETFRLNYNSDEPTPVTFVDFIIHSWDESYFRKYYLSTIIYKNWQKYNHCFIRRTDDIDVELDYELNWVMKHIHKKYQAIYTWKSINNLFCDSEQFISDIDERIHLDPSTIRTDYDKLELADASPTYDADIAMYLV